MKYRTKPATVEAIQWNGSNHEEILAWAERLGFDGYYDDGRDGIIVGHPLYGAPLPYIKLTGCGGPTVDHVGMWFVITIDGPGDDDDDLQAWNDDDFHVYHEEAE